jgi:methyl-accepting chemotaxis protein
MTAAIDARFAPEYERLREDFNRAMGKLLAAMRAVVENAGAIAGEVQGITQASNELSARTENQAATLEETAAALDQLTASVKSSAERATQAAKVVHEARSSAEDSGTVVREAVAAMGEIAQSSRQISKIIGVIDDIAFQTNLLTLNAGVEAARAGDAGRGFAVVASEVRALAQRSSDAAREINGLISSSGAQVKRGVDLVGETGSALEKIVASVAGIAAHVGEIASSSTEQSQGLVENNQAMTQLDHVTQQNAAMFEETSAASQALARAADALSETVGRFRTDAGSAAPIPFRPVPKANAADMATRAKPARPADTQLPRKAVNAAPGTADADDEGWAEF